MVKDAAGNITKYKFDKAGRVTRVTTGYGIVKMKYDDCDRITHITDAEGHTTILSYDKSGNMTGAITPKQYILKARTQWDIPCIRCNG